MPAGTQAQATGSPGIHKDYQINTGKMSTFELENDYLSFFKKVMGGVSRTHSCLVGQHDHRMPKSGLFDVNAPEKLTKLNAAIVFFYREKKPMMLCEFATPRFHFFEDVDLLLPKTMDENQLYELEKEAIQTLLRYRSAALAAVWRADDPLGSVPYAREDGSPPVCHVFSSSGWSNKHQSYKISLHFIWPELVTTPKEAKGIRGKTIDYFNNRCEKQPNCPLVQLLAKAGHFENNPKASFDNASPWEDIFDKAATEQTSLRLAFCDKGSKSDKVAGTATSLEGRAKVPVGTFSIPLIPGKPDECTPTLVCGPQDQSEEAWLACSSIRIDESCDPLAHTKVPSTVWFSSFSNKNMSDLRFLPLGPELTNVEMQRKNPYDACAENLSGWWQTGEGVTYYIKRPEITAAEMYNVYKGEEAVGYIRVSDVYNSVISLTWHKLNGLSFTGHFRPGHSHYFELESGNEAIFFRRLAVATEEDGVTLKQFPSWCDTLLLEVGGAASEADKTMALAAMIVCCKAGDDTRYETFWKGHFTITPADIIEEGDSQGATVNVAIANLASAVFVLRALWDLRAQVKASGAQIVSIMLSSDHTIVESALEKNTSKYLTDLTEVLDSAKLQLVEASEFGQCLEIQSHKLSAKENKASKMAKEFKATAHSDDIPASSMFSFELFDAMVKACKDAVKKTDK